MTDGTIFGAEQFVEQVFDRHWDKIASPKRETGARSMRSEELGGLRSLRDLRGNADS